MMQWLRGFCCESSRFVLGVVWWWWWWCVSSLCVSVVFVHLLRICLSVSLSGYLSVNLSLYMSVCLAVCLPVSV